MDVRTAETAKAMLVRLGEATGPDRDLDLQVYSLVTGHPLEWAEPKPAAGDAIWVRRAGDDSGTLAPGAVAKLRVGVPAGEAPPSSLIALPRLTGSTDDALAQVRAAGFVTCEIEANLSSRLKIRDEARIQTWEADEYGTVGRGPTRTGYGANPALAVCGALVQALLGRAGFVPEAE